MRIQTFPTLIINFDDTYIYQPQILSLGRVIDLRDISQVRYLCSYEKLEILKKLIPVRFRGIKFLGKSDFHYVSYLFLREIEEPFDLIVMDHHLDFMDTFEGYISCGSWVKESLKLENLKRIFIISDDNTSTTFVNSKIFVLENNPLLLKKLLKDFPVYISMDKDIVRKDYLNTNWEQGSFTLEDIINILSLLIQHKILGVDICGEPDFNLIEYKKSEYINLKIWETINREQEIRFTA
ncbi:MAG: hypothetical protein ACPLKX_08465 [Dictyoglomaceae bacterium]